MTTLQSMPATPEAITPEWLTGALREAGVIGAAAVAAVDVDPIGQGAGILCRLARVTVAYDRVEDGAPATLVAKLPSHDPQTRQITTAFRFYEREVRFYNEVATEVALPTPRRYYGRFDPPSGDFVLLLEDLAVSGRLGDQVAGASLADAETVVEELARLHAAWWNRPRLAELDWLPGADSPINKGGMQLYPVAWGPFMERIGGQLSARMRATGERLSGSFDPILERFVAGPRTILHGDSRLDNFFFAAAPGQPPLRVIDWQIAIQGVGAYDIGYFFSQSLPVELRRTHERDLLRRYHDLLVQGGVSDYSFDQLLSDYRWTLLFCFAYPVIGGGMGDLANERGHALALAMMERSAAAIEDWDAGALLDEL